MLCFFKKKMADNKERKYTSGEIPRFVDMCVQCTGKNCIQKKKKIRVFHPFLSISQRDVFQLCSLLFPTFIYSNDCLL